MLNWQNDYYFVTPWYFSAVRTPRLNMSFKAFMPLGLQASISSGVMGRFIWESPTKHIARIDKLTNVVKAKKTVN